MGRIIAIANQKGGVGKTTTSINLSACIAAKGKKVLVIDIDPQGNTTSGLGIEKENVENSVYELMLGECSIREITIKTEIENLYILPSNVNLAGAEIELIGVNEREYILKNEVDYIKDNFDFIIIDCPPSLGIITTNALTASNSVIIPVQCEFFALEGITQLLNSIIMVQSSMNPSLRIEGVLLTMLDGRTIIGLEVIEEVRKYFKDKVFNTIIPRLVRLVEAPSHGKPINEYDPTSRATEAYHNLAKEVIERNGQQQQQQ